MRQRSLTETNAGAQPSGSADEQEQLLAQVKSCLGTTLQLDSVEHWTADTRLLGSVPELDSMAVVTVLLSMEEYFGIEVEDDEISAETFETVGTLSAFVAGKLHHPH